MIGVSRPLDRETERAVECRATAALMTDAWDCSKSCAPAESSMYGRWLWPLSDEMRRDMRAENCDRRFDMRCDSRLWLLSRLPMGMFMRAMKSELSECRGLAALTGLMGLRGLIGVVGLSRPGLRGPFGTAVSELPADLGGTTFSIVAVSGSGGGTFLGMMRAGGSFFSMGTKGDTAGGPNGVVGVERCSRSRSDDTLSFFRASMRAWSIGGAGLRLPEGVLRCPMLLPESGVATPLVSVDWD